MIGHHDDLFDDVALLALGVLPAAEAERVAAHVRSCEACLAEYASLRSTANAIGYAAVEPGTVDEVAAARRKSRLMNAVRGSNGEAGAAPAVATVATAPLPEAVPAVAPAAAQTLPPASLEAARRRRPALGAYAALAAAAVIAFASITSNYGLRRERAQERDEIKTLQQRNGTLDGALAELAAPDSKRFPVPGGEVITRNGTVIVALHDLAPPPHGKVYQAWTLANGAKAVAPSLTFSPDAGGVAFIKLPQSATNLAAVAVSIEPAGGSKAPTSKPKFIRKLS